MKLNVIDRQMERQKKTNQYFPTETVNSSYQTCLPPDDENIFSNPYITGRLLMGCKESNQRNKKTWWDFSQS